MFVLYEKWVPLDQVRLQDLRHLVCIANEVVQIIRGCEAKKSQHITLFSNDHKCEHIRQFGIIIFLSYDQAIFHLINRNIKLDCDQPSYIVKDMIRFFLQRLCRRDIILDVGALYFLCEREILQLVRINIKIIVLFVVCRQQFRIVIRYRVRVDCHRARLLLPLVVGYGLNGDSRICQLIGCDT